MKTPATIVNITENKDIKYDLVKESVVADMST